MRQPKRRPVLLGRYGMAWRRFGATPRSTRLELNAESAAQPLTPPTVGGQLTGDLELRGRLRELPIPVIRALESGERGNYHSPSNSSAPMQFQTARSTRAR